MQEVYLFIYFLYFYKLFASSIIYISTQRREKGYFKWSDERDHELMKQLIKYGKQWAYVQQNFFANLKVKQLRNRFYYLTKNNQNDSILS